MSGKRYNEDQVQFIKDNYLKYPVKKIAEMIGGSYCGVMGVINRSGLEIPKEIRDQRKKSNHFKKGNISYNKGKKQTEFMSKEAIERTKKTRFKKGHTPHNSKYNGAERLTKDGYIEIRVKRGKYRLKHIVEWEKVNGKLPDNHCLKCLDGNKENTNPSNWKLITRIENMYNNSKINYPKEIIPSLVLVKQIDNQINTLENAK